VARNDRKGNRFGRSHFRDAIQAEVERVESIAMDSDPVEAINAVGDAIAALDDALADLALPRLRAIAALRRDGWSYDKIADATNLSKPRVAQLARDALERKL
jgi:DNA-directed RNA polymerase specialized sigma24 family protein